MAVNYVKFFRGTPEAFQKLTNKNNDTLYFISRSDDAEGSLYLGSKLISSGISSLSDLYDIAIDDILADGQILAYDEVSEKWVNKSVFEAIGVMIGAQADKQGSEGLVPAPGIGQQNLFLRGDGKWAAPEVDVAESLSGDNKTISIENSVISLKDFGKKYYKYVPATDSEVAHYAPQEVNTAFPWKAYLEPKVIEENGELVLGWFEPNPTTIEGVQDQIVELSADVKKIDEDLSKVSNNLINNYYDKTATENYVAGEIAKVNHLTRKTFNSLEEAQAFADSETYPDNYIYMVLASTDFWGENNKYDEYLYVDGTLEKVGAWDTDLSDYAKLSDLDNYVEKRTGYDLVLDTDIAKLSSIESGAQKNYISSVDVDFNVSEGKLFLNDISISKISNLESILNKKAETSAVENLASQLNIVNGKVTDLTTELTKYLLKEDYEEDMAVVMNAITWQNLSE